MSFLEIALRNAARGWRVFPVVGKAAVVSDWPNAATTDTAQIEEWAKRFPKANVGVAGGREFVGLDTDRLDELKRRAADAGLSPEVFKTFTVTSQRENRAHFYYLPTDAVETWGIKSANEKKSKGIDGNIFETKTEGAYLVGEGSAHKDTGKLYVITADLPLIPFPSDLLALLQVIYQENTSKGTGAKWDGIVYDGEGRDAFLTSEAGKMRRLGHSEAIILAALRELNAERCAPPKSEEDIRRIARSVGKYEIEEELALIIGGGANAPASEDIEELDNTVTKIPLPVYPLEVWDGTLYLEFALLASRDNYVPPEFFVEAAMTYAGALTANQLHCESEALTPRLYTVLLAPPGSGKGTTYRRVHPLFEPSRLMTQVGEQPPLPCAALLARAASENGLNDALLTHPHVISDFEEMDQMMEKTRIEGSGGALMSCIRSLFDDTRPGLTTSKGRPVIAELGYFSLLGSMTHSLWRKAMEGRDSYGSGLGGRFNLVATNEDRTAAILMTPDFSPHRKALDAKLAALDSSPQMIGIEPAAQKLLAEWWEGKNKPFHNRVNVIAGRKALHLAWITGQPSITLETMRKAIQLAEYLVAIRTAFAVAQGEERAAITENRVLQILGSISPKAASAKNLVRLLDGLMSRRSVYGSLQSLVETAEVEKHEVRDTKSGRKYSVFRLSAKHVAGSEPSGKKP